MNKSITRRILAVFVALVTCGVFGYLAIAELSEFAQGFLAGIGTAVVRTGISCAGISTHIWPTRRFFALAQYACSGCETHNGKRYSLQGFSSAFRKSFLYIFCFVIWRIMSHFFEIY